ncbi:MAG: hypothetical protein U0169_05830 [Polyangiaceae bacterium]
MPSTSFRSSMLAPFLGIVASSTVACGSSGDPPVAEKAGAATRSGAGYDVDELIADVRAYATASKAEGRVPDRNRFLATLPESFRKRYTILTSSDAEDYVDSKDPTDARVLAFGDTAELTLAWAKHSDALQVAQHRGSKLELRSIQFATSEGKEVVVSDANPSACASSSCHGATDNPRYRWDAYPRWKKAMAKDFDFVRPGDEEKRVRAFFDAAAGDTAFSMLARDFGVPDTIGTFRVGKPPEEATTSDDASPTGKLLTANDAPAPVAYSYQFRPNTFLTLTYARHHAEQMYRQMSEGDPKRFALYEHPLLFVLTKCAWPADDAVGRDAVNRRLELESGKVAPLAPRIDVGPEPAKWMPWLTFLGPEHERWVLADVDVEGPEDVGQHLYNEGFTSLVYFVGARVWDHARAARPLLDANYRPGTNRRLENALFADLTYENRAALDAQVDTFDALGTFLDVEARPYLQAARDEGHAGRITASCASLEAIVRQQFQLPAR